MGRARDDERHLSVYFEFWSIREVTVFSVQCFIHIGARNFSFKSERDK